MLATLRKCLALVPPGMGPRFAALVPLAVLTAAFEAVGAAAVFGLIRILTEPAQAATMPVAATLVRWLPRQDERGVIIAATVLVAVLYVAKNALVAATTYLRNRCVEEATATTSAAMLRIYLGAPYSFHLRRNSAELIYNADQAVQRVFGTVVASAVGVATEALVALGIVAVLLAAAPRVTAVTGIVLIAVSWLFLAATRRSAVGLGRRLDALREATLRHLQQGLGAVKEIKVLGRGRYFADAFARDQRALARVRWLYGTFAAMPRIVVETVFVAGALLVILLTTLGGSAGAESVALLGLYAYAGFRVIPSANRIVWLLSEIRVGSPAIDRVHADLVGTRAWDTEMAAVSAPCPLRERLDLERVSYAYEGSDRPVLAEVSLTIRCGEAVGIVGTTGIGKSTLVDLIVGLLEPSGGRISVDGADIRTCLAGWQREIGYVPQTIFLVDDTLRRNIALGVADAEVNESRVRAAVRSAQLDAFIAALPRGLDTVVGERGMRLSGGERQRIGIARALYHEPSVLVFDEATSALDSRTEAELAEAIDVLRIDRTLILVAHRLTTVRRCDRLVFLADGRVADVGTFDELAARNVAFRDMAVAGGG
jgi:ABC-type multidrug transport system fused ATPase/permease subunit